MSEPLFAVSTCPDADSAARIARTLVDERLAACINRLPGAVSTYRWQGRIEEDPEIVLFIKTTRACWPALRDRLVALHPHDVPELIVLPITDGLPAYLEWLQQVSQAID